MRKLLFFITCLICSLTFKSQCTYTITMLDTYGDGWNNWADDYYITIYINGTPLTTAQLQDGSIGYETFTVNNGDEITTTFDGSGIFPEEIF